MKLVEINDIRAGQIYKRDNVLYLIRYILFNLENTDPVWICIEYGEDYQETESMFNGNATVESVEKQGYELIGFLGITHKIENEKLVEIPREELQIDDVIEFAVLCEEYDFEVYKAFYKVVYRFSIIQDEEETFVCIGNNGNSYNVSRNDFNGKVGILGVNYEFVNNQLVK